MKPAYHSPSHPFVSPNRLQAAWFGEPGIGIATNFFRSRSGSNPRRRAHPARTKALESRPALAFNERLAGSAAGCLTPRCQGNRPSRVGSAGEARSLRDAMPNTVVGVAASLLDQTSPAEPRSWGLRPGYRKARGSSFSE